MTEAGAPADGVVLACDLGGTSFRAALVDASGVKLAAAAIPGPTLADRMGFSEVDATKWWDVFSLAAARLAEAAPRAFAAVEAVAICGVTRTQVFLGRDGRQLRPAMTWKDARAERVAARLAEILPAAHPEAGRVNAFHPLARLAWLREEEPLSFRGLARVLEPKDYLNARLTGRQASDPVSVARLLAAAEPAGDAGSLLDAIGAPASLLPPLLEPWEEVGPVLKGLPAPLDQLAGARVMCGASDTWAAVLGLGAMRPGYAYNISGTTEVLGLTASEPAFAEGLLTVDWRGLHQLGGPSQNGADTLAWLVSVLEGGARSACPNPSPGAEIGRAAASLLSGRRHAQPVLFLPYLQGERVPHWDAARRGAFLGLGRAHGPTDLAWAVLEGVGFLNRLVLERAEAATGARVREIRFGGGAAANAAWAQAKADICRRPVAVGEASEPGVLGCAILALRGLGRLSSLAEGQERLVRIARRFEPNPACAAAYDALYDLHRRADEALAPVSRGLVELARRPGALPGVHAPPSVLASPLASSETAA